MRHGAALRLAVAVLVATAAWFAPLRGLPQTRWLLAWDIGVLVWLVSTWSLILRTDAAATRARAESLDPSGYAIFLLVLSAAIASTAAIAYLVGSTKSAPAPQRLLHLGLSLAALVGAWLLIQTLFTFHYARGYYGGPLHDPAGLVFPGGQPPDYLDFAYHAFVVGMTSQVSDVDVISRPMRRLTLLHGVLAFLFNLVVLALSVNIVAGAI